MVDMLSNSSIMGNMLTKDHALAIAFSVFEREHGLTACKLLMPHKVSLNQMSIVSHLSRNEALTVSDLAQLTVADKSSTSRTIAGLERLGWVIKVTSEADRRKSFVQLTAKGLKKAKIAGDICDSLSKTMEHGLTASEKSQLINLLSKVSESFTKNRNK